MINPEFFLHESLGKASPHARLLFISLWTQADREGRLRWLPLRIHGEAFPHEPRVSVDKLAAELVEADVLILYRIKDRTFAQIPGFPKWQRPHKNETASRCPGPPEVGGPLAGQRTTNDGPDTEYGIRITGYEIRNKDSSSKSLVQDNAEAVVPDPLPDGPVAVFLLDTWPRGLGKSSTLGRWIKQSEKAFPAVDLLGEARKASAWELSQPSRKKTQVRAFLTRWWSRCQDRGGSSSHSSSSVDSEALEVARRLGATL
tara:strand:+ start:95 stop:868 length:774 start_codon:yes stop_codon:yes gene_type:complete